MIERGQKATELKLNQFQIAWTPDCQGKWDLDGPIISVSTRYWPRGGGFFIVTRTANGATIDETGDPEIRPAAHSSVGIQLENTGFLDIADQQFEGDSEAEVKAQVEAWVSEQTERIVRAVLREYGLDEAVYD